MSLTHTPAAHRRFHHEPHVAEAISQTMSAATSAWGGLICGQGVGAPPRFPPEAVVHLVRKLISIRDRSSQIVCEKLIELLLHYANRSALALARRHAPFISPMAQEEIAETVVTDAIPEWISLNGAHEFWEIRFAFVLSRRVKSEMDRAIRRDNLEVPLEQTLGSETLDRSDESCLDLTNSHISRIAVAKALAGLPQPVQNAFALCRLLGCSEMEAAGHLNVSDRTIRNYLARAEEAARKGLQEEVVPHAAQ